jgi:hypothetical protein
VELKSLLETIVGLSITQTKIIRWLKEYSVRFVFIRRKVTLMADNYLSDLEVALKEMTIVEDDWLHLGLVKFGNKYRTTDEFDVIFKILSRLIAKAKEKGLTDDDVGNLDASFLWAEATMKSESSIGAIDEMRRLRNKLQYFTVEKEKVKA